MSHRASIDLKPAELGLLLSGEPLTTGGGVREADAWTWDLTRHRPLRPFVTADARELLVKLDGLSGARAEQPYVPVSPDATPTSTVWLAVLADGASCYAIYAMADSPGGMSLSYVCKEGDLYGNLNGSGAIWTIWEQKKGAADMTLAPVAEAYS